MLDVHILPRAVEDLEAIYAYTYNSWGLRQAEKYQDELNNGFSRIAQNPTIGAAYIYMEGGYRKLSVNKHIIFYKVSNTKIIVVRVLHERMDINLHV